MNRPRTVEVVAALLALLGCGAVPGITGGLSAQPALADATFQLGAGAEAADRDEGALFLLLPNGAQGVGMGRAMTALPSSEAAFWNPAGLADLDGSRIIVTRGEHLAGDATSFSALHSATGARALGVSYQLLDGGTFDATDQEGNVTGSITVRNHQALLSAAAGIGTRIRLGGSVKMVQFRTTCRGECVGIDAGVSATAYALDLGIQGRPLGDRPLRIGFMLAHLGPDFRVRNADQSDPLPARMRLGASYDLLHELVEEDLAMNLVVEVEDRLRDPGHASLYVGGEFTAGATDRVFVRGGYILGDRNETDGAALGFGVRYERFEFGFARSMARGGPASDSEPVHFTLGLIL